MSYKYHPQQYIDSVQVDAWLFFLLHDIKIVELPSHFLTYRSLK